MNLSKAAIHILFQLDDLVRQVKDEDFVRPLPTLSDSSLGQHVRHTIEFFLCFKRGLETGVINYDKRTRDTSIERDRNVALAALADVVRFLESIRHEQYMTLEVGFDLTKDESISIPTNSTRELVYNIEHAVHHMAIVKIAVREIAPYVALDKSFGVAASTIRFKDAPPSVTVR